MNKFYLFVSSSYTSEAIIALYKVLREKDKNITELINLTSCDQLNRDIANQYNIQSCPSLLVIGKNGERLEHFYGTFRIFDKIDFLFSKYGQ